MHKLPDCMLALGPGPCHQLLELPQACQGTASGLILVALCPRRRTSLPPEVAEPEQMRPQADRACQGQSWVGPRSCPQRGVHRLAARDQTDLA